MRLLLLLLLTSSFTFAQNTSFHWAKTVGGSQYTDEGADVNVDNQGNIYITGRFEGTVDLDPGPNVKLFTALGSEDIFIIKLDACGDFIWAKQLGGSYVGTQLSDNSYSLEVDDQENIYLAGHFRGTMDADPGIGVYNMIGNNYLDGFLLKLDINGDLIWGHPFQSSWFSCAYEMVRDELGSIYVVGTYTDVVDFDPGPGVYNQTSLGSSDIFIMKLTETGQLVWVNSIGGVGTEYGRCIGLDNAGNLFIGGEFDDAVDFDPGAGSEILTPTLGYDAYIEKFDTSGGFIWVKAFGGPLTDSPWELEVDPQGNVVTAGYYWGPTDFDPGPGLEIRDGSDYEYFIHKLDAAGNLMWVVTEGGGSNDYAYAMDMDSTGSTYVSGCFQGTVDFDPALATSHLITSTSSSADVFIQKLDSAGNFEWVETFGGDNTDIAYGLKVSKSGDIFTTGDFYNTADLNPGSGVFTAVSNGGKDMFIQKLSQDSLPTLDVSVTEIGGILTASSGNSSYQWISCADSSLIIGATQQEFTPTVAGDYAVIINADCLADTSQCIGSSVGLEEAGVEPRISVYPIPFEANINVKLPSSTNWLELQLIDLTGKIIRRQLFNDVSLVNWELAVPDGVYVLEISGQGIAKVRRRVSTIP
ncbi:MAG: hypothetical protein ACI837_001216 [Crocinitomicaceae bacterium]|jgi:hypothetical protein